jgi:ATP/maltotriose-dependent transcriptional regulator MalT
VAPTGYGKSTLVSDWLNHCAVRSAWLALDSEDNDLRQFLKNVVAAIQHLNPGACEQLQGMLQSATLPPVLVLASELVDETEKLNEPFILAIDNFHEIKNKLIPDLLSHFLSAPKSSLHLVIITRQSPFLPLDVLRAGHDISELRVQDLSFSEQDTAALLGQAFAQTVAAETAKEWLEQSDGWVSALVLMIEKAKATDGGSLQTPGFRGGNLASGVSNGPDPDSSAADNSVTWRELLTNREYEILLLLEERLRDKEIADRLCISPETVRSHLKNLYSKLHATDRRDAIVKATRLGILDKT